jgi:hypothetical protein
MSKYAFGLEDSITGDKEMSLAEELAQELSEIEPTKGFVTDEEWRQNKIDELTNSIAASFSNNGDVFDSVVLGVYMAKAAKNNIRMLLDDLHPESLKMDCIEEYIRVCLADSLLKENQEG